jgi:hypothetical protein
MTQSAIPALLGGMILLVAGWALVAGIVLAVQWLWGTVRVWGWRKGWLPPPRWWFDPKVTKY